MKSFLTHIVAALAFNSVLAAPVVDDTDLETGLTSVLPLSTTLTRGPPRGTGGVVIPTLIPTRRPGGPNGTRPTQSRPTDVVRPTHVIGDPSKPVPIPSWLQRLIDAILAHLPKSGSNGDCDKDGEKPPPHRPTTTRGPGTGRPTPPGSITFAPPRPTNNSTLPITTRTGGVGPSITRGVTLSTVTTSRGGSRTTTAEDPDETGDY